MNNQEMETFVVLTEVKQEIIKKAIEQTKCTDAPVIVKQIKENLDKHYSNKTAARKRYEKKRMGMDTDEGIADTVESYIAYFENELISKGYMKHPIGGMLRERIKIENRKKCKH